MRMYEWETAATRYALMFVRLPNKISEGTLVVGPFGFDTTNISNAVIIRDGSHIDYGYHVREKMGVRNAVDATAVAVMLARVLNRELVGVPPNLLEKVGDFDPESGLVYDD